MTTRRVCPAHTFNRTLERYGYHGEPMELIAVTREQAMDPRYIKSRQKVEGQNVNNPRYERETGLDYGVQVEAIPGADLRTMIVAAIEERMDLEALEEAKAVNKAVSEWVTEHVDAIIAEYEETHEPLDATIVSAGELLDPRTSAPLERELWWRYLPQEGDEQAQAIQRLRATWVDAITDESVDDAERERRRQAYEDAEVQSLVDAMTKYDDWE